MSPIAHIPSHRKPRRAAASTRALRAGMTGGFLTLAVAGAAVPASAAEPSAHEATLEMPTVSDTLANTAAQTAAATQQAASGYELQAQQDQAAAQAKTAAKKAKAEADKKEREAEARRAAAKKAAEARAEKASRSAERATLSTTSVSNATGNAAAVISFLKAQLGKAYVLGSSGPSSYDCSSLTQAAFKQVGIDLPRVSQDQSATGTQVSLDNLQAGDL